MTMLCGKVITALLIAVMFCTGAAPAFAAESEAEPGAKAGQIDAVTQQVNMVQGEAETVQDPQDDSEPQDDPGEEVEPWAPGDPILAPEGVSVAVLNSSQLLLVWNAAIGCAGYEVEYAKNALFLFDRKVSIDDPAGTDLTLQGLTTSSKYFVRIRSVYTAEGRDYYSDWVRVSTSKASAQASIRFVKKNGKKFDVRKQAGKKLKKYTIAQGCCSDGTYIYMAFERRNGDSNGKKKARIKIAKVRISDWKLVKVSPKGMKLGHANDLTYNPYKKYLVVTGAKTKDPYVRIVSPKSLKKTGTKKVRLSSAHKRVKAFNSIDFDAASRTYMIRSRNYGGLTFTLDESFREKGARTILTTWASRHVQSCTTSGGNLILTQSWHQSSTKNTLTIFDQAGRKLQDIKIKMKGELESVFMIGGKLYASMHKKLKGYKTGYLFEIKL